MNTLIDRYVFTAVRHVPEKQRTDIDRELRASIDDAVDARIEAGEDHDAAVDATLRELGDPRRLADQYADRPQYLLGPDLYPVWRGIMKMLYTIVLPIVVVVLAGIQAVADPNIGRIIGTSIGATLTIAAHMLFWTTGVFWILDRTGVGREELATDEWTPAALPKYEPRSMGIAELAGLIVWPVLVIAALVLQQFTFTAEPVLDPANWSFWWPYLLVLFVLEIAYAFWVYRLAAWTHAVTAVNAVLALAVAVPVVWLLASDKFFNPEYIDSLNWGEIDNPGMWLTRIVVVSVIFGTGFDIIDTGLKAERARRGLATAIPGTQQPY
ncbi:permease prefix domain 1-containing protein [Cryptosporangium arvum]|uniref:permease prefix domain 1-containing protein n=1 Tax=Cryptosporangium arvum TaxID=80871 RepID=UPI0004B727B0|nr:permease prefix domain 1-containing protein [Cryptosporangium arvum]